MTKKSISPESPPEAPPESKPLPESPPEAPKTLPESPPETPKSSPPETLKVSEKTTEMIEKFPKTVQEFVPETKSSPPETPKPLLESPPEKPKKRKQSPKQLANLAKGRNKKSSEAPPENKIPAPNKTWFYFGIGIGIIASGLGIWKLYQMYKSAEKEESPKPELKVIPNDVASTNDLSKEQKIQLKRQAEKLQKIAEAKRNWEQI